MFVTIPVFTSVNAPAINLDLFNNVSPSPRTGNSFLDVLDNDVSAPGGGQLRVERCFEPERRNLRKLQGLDGEIAEVQEGDSAPSEAGGVCVPTGNRERVRYTPPSVGYAGADSCRYEACDERYVCGENNWFCIVPCLPIVDTPDKRSSNARKVCFLLYRSLIHSLVYL